MQKKIHLHLIETGPQALVWKENTSKPLSEGVHFELWKWKFPAFLNDNWQNPKVQ